MGFYFRVFAIFLAWVLFSSFQHNPVTHEAIFLSQLGITPPEQSLTNEKLRETYSENHGRISLTENQDDGKLNTEHKKSCNCEEFCIDARTTELEKILWIENKPIFCREAARIQIKDEQYLAKCFLFCCRQCNLAYYKCAPTNPTGYCLKAAYDCAWKCKKDSLLKITIKGWK